MEVCTAAAAWCINAPHAKFTLYVLGPVNTWRAITGATQTANHIELVSCTQVTQQRASLQKKTAFAGHESHCWMKGVGTNDHQD